MLVGVPLQVLVTGECLGVGVGVRRFRSGLLRMISMFICAQGGCETDSKRRSDRDRQRDGLTKVKLY
jgi:hypothetical protein